MPKIYALPNVKHNERGGVHLAVLFPKLMFNVMHQKKKMSPERQAKFNLEMQPPWFLQHQADAKILKHHKAALGW